MPQYRVIEGGKAGVDGWVNTLKEAGGGEGKGISGRGRNLVRG